MGYVYKWIEGRKNLDAYCEKRFKEKPRFTETIGFVGDITIHLIYKLKPNAGYVEMFLMFMKHPLGEITDINELSRMTYEEIRTDKNSILND